MKQLFSPQRLGGLILLVGVMVCVKVVWFGVAMVWLPRVGVDHLPEVESRALYYRVKLSPNTVAPPKKQPKPRVKRVPQGTIKSLKLLALYHAFDTTVITVKYKGKSKVLSRGDEIAGFRLKGGGSNFALFSRGEQEYTLYIDKSKTAPITRHSTPKHRVEKASSGMKVEGEVIDAGDHKIVDKALVTHYAGNLKEVMKNIGIVEVREGTKLAGFRVSFIRRGSHFAKLGLQRGDIIRSVNGEVIQSYSAAMRVYKNINTMDSLSLTITRGKKEMELEYEVN